MRREKKRRALYAPFAPSVVHQRKGLSADSDSSSAKRCGHRDKYVADFMMRSCCVGDDGGAYRAFDADGLSGRELHDGVAGANLNGDASIVAKK